MPSGCCNKIPQTERLDQQKCVSSSGGRKSKIQVPAGGLLPRRGRETRCSPLSQFLVVCWDLRVPWLVREPPSFYKNSHIGLPPPGGQQCLGHVGHHPGRTVVTGIHGDGRGTQASPTRRVSVPAVSAAETKSLQPGGTLSVLVEGQGAQAGGRQISPRLAREAPRAPAPGPSS